MKKKEKKKLDIKYNRDREKRKIIDSVVNDNPYSPDIARSWNWNKP